MSGLLDQYGRPLNSAAFKKATPPKTGEAFGKWSTGPYVNTQMPNGGLIQFDLSKLTLADYRAMREHYQVNASLSVLTFMLHQSDWRIECEDKKIADHCEENLREIWTPLCRALGTAHWAGYSPNVLNWENDVNRKSIWLNKVKDLYPEDCDVNWKDVEGWAPPGHQPPKFKIYDGIKQWGAQWPIPVENSLWFPLLMENGDYSGKKLLRPAFTSWFFSILMHLFANRYYERFGEPVPVGRAPFDEEIQVGDVNNKVRGNEFLLTVLQALRSRSAVVLPNDKTDMGNGKIEFDYDIEYLESQMRGADFERYMTRLDEEISIGIFTPILMLRTADVGSYNLGVGHMQMYLWMLNALNADRALYINKFILRRMADFNFSLRAPDPKIVFRKMGNSDTETVRAMLTELVRSDKAKPDLEELGVMAGLTLKEIREVTADGSSDPEVDPRIARQNPAADKGTGPKGTGEPRSTAKAIAARIQPQVVNAFNEGRFGPGFKLDMGYKRRMEEAFKFEGVRDATLRVDELYEKMDYFVRYVSEYASSDFQSADQFVEYFWTKLNREVDALVAR